MDFLMQIWSTWQRFVEQNGAISSILCHSCGIKHKVFSIQKKSQLQTRKMRNKAQTCALLFRTLPATRIVWCLKNPHCITWYHTTAKTNTQQQQHHVPKNFFAVADQVQQETEKRREQLMQQLRTQQNKVNHLHVCTVRAVRGIEKRIILPCFVEQNWKAATDYLHELLACRQKQDGLYVFQKTLTMLLKGLCFTARKPEWGFNLLRDVQKKLLCLTIHYNIVIEGFTRENNTTRTEAVLKSMEEQTLEPDVCTLSSLLHVYSKSMGFVKLLEFLHQFRSKHPHVAPNHKILAFLLHQGLIMGHIQKQNIMDFFEQLRKQGIEYNRAVLNAVIDGLIKQKRVDQALSLLQYLKAEHNYDTKDLLDHQSYTSIVTGYIKTGEYNEAYAVMNAMSEQGMPPTKYLLSAVLSGYASKGQVEQAQNKLETIPEFLHDISLYNCIIHGYCNNGQWNEAYKVLEIIKSKNIVPDIVTFNTLLSGLDQEVEDGKTAIQTILRQMKSLDITPNIVTYKILLRKYAQFPDGLPMIHETVAVMKKQGIHDSPETHALVINGYLKAKKFREAEELIVSLLKQGVTFKLVSFNNFLNALACQVPHQSMEFIVQKMRQNNVTPDTATYGNLMRSLVHTGNVSKVESLIREMQQQGIEPDDFCYIMLLKAYDHGRDMSKAETVYQILKKRKARVSPVYVRKYEAKAFAEEKNKQKKYSGTDAFRNAQVFSEHGNFEGQK